MVSSPKALFDFIIRSKKKFGIWGLLLSTILIFTVPVLPKIIDYFSPAKASPQSQMQQINVTQNNSGISPNNSEVGSAGKEETLGVDSKSTDINFQKWLVKNYDKPTDDGFLCPSPWSSFSSPEIWYDKLVPVNFRRIKIAFEIKNKDENSSETPTLIFSLGDTTRILRFYLPQKTKSDASTYVGFQKIKPGCDKWGDCNWEPPQSLDEPMATGPGKEATLEIRSLYKGENKLGYIFTVNYPSAKTFETKKKDFTYEVIIPRTDPSSYLIKFGVGSFKGGCFKINPLVIEE